MDYTKKQRDNFVALNKRLNGYVSLVRTIYDRLNRQASEIVLSSPYTSDSEDPFRFDDYKELGARVEDLQVNFVKELRKVIQTGENVEWRRGEESQLRLIDDIIAIYGNNKGSVVRPAGLAKVGSDNSEITDSYKDLFLPKGVSSRVDDIKKYRTFNQVKKYFEGVGVKLETDSKALNGKDGDADIDVVAEAGQNLIAAYESYIELFGKDALKKLRVIRLVDNSLEDSQAVYNYNRIGENDPLAGVIQFRQLSYAGAHNVFHEFAHVYQDSISQEDEDALVVSEKAMKSISGTDRFKAYFGAKKSDLIAEAMADGIVSCFFDGTQEGVDFLRDLQGFQSGRSGDSERFIIFNSKDEALKAFKNRKDKGFTLSAKLWNQSKVYKKELEDTISVALEKGMSAVTLSKRVSKYLEDFPSMKRDYTEKYGTASDARDCQYESIRLARTEINMAYRNAEHERWNNMDFVLGFEIKMSGSHPRFDICDELQGKYPKTFKWSGWHPNCFCYSIPILMTREQFDNWSEGDKVEGMIEDMPENFNKWVRKNSGRIKMAEKRDSLPYFLSDNRFSYENILKLPKKMSREYINLTPEEIRYFEDVKSEIYRNPQYTEGYGKKDMEIAVEKFIDMYDSNETRDTMLMYHGDVLHSGILEDVKEGKFKIVVADVEFFMYGRGLANEQVQNARLISNEFIGADFSSMQEYMNSRATRYEFYHQTGFWSYEEAYDSLGGREAVEKKLKELSDSSSIYMAIEGGRFCKIVKNNDRIKNSLETGRGSYKVVGENRKGKELTMFGMNPDTPDRFMPKYGFLASSGKMDCENIVEFKYGDIFLEFNDSVKPHSTMTAVDSYDGNSFSQKNKQASMMSPAVCVNNPQAEMSIGWFMQKGAKGTRQLVEASAFADIKTTTYTECQIYGDLNISDIKRVHVSSKSQAERIRKVIKSNGYDIEVVPCMYDQRVFKLSLFVSYDENYDEISKYVYSLGYDEVDAIQDKFIDGIFKRIAEDASRVDVKKMGEISESQKELLSLHSINPDTFDTEAKREYIKRFYKEIDKGDEGLFAQSKERAYRKKSYSGWVYDVYNEDLIIKKK